MPIILLIVSTLAFWALYWFVQMGGIEHFRERKKQKQDDAKRSAAKEAARTAPLRAVEDPRDAAAVLMLLIARQNGDPTREQVVLIEDKLRNVFGFEHELTERMTQARFVARQAIDFDQAAGVFAVLFKKKLTADERYQLIDMLDEVARLETASQAQIEALSAFRPMLGLAAA